MVKIITTLMIYMNNRVLVYHTIQEKKMSFSVDTGDREGSTSSSPCSATLTPLFIPVSI